MSLSNSLCCQMTSLVKNVKYPIKIQVIITCARRRVAGSNSRRSWVRIEKLYNFTSHNSKTADCIQLQILSLAKIFPLANLIGWMWPKNPKNKAKDISKSTIYLRDCQQKLSNRIIKHISWLSEIQLRCRKLEALDK